jgi:solute carrier family 25, member 39/40
MSCFRRSNIWIATPLDVVRVRLQSQNVSTATAASRSSFSPSAAFGGSNLGVTACCREVFWVSNDAQWCLASSPGTPSFQGITAPAHTTSSSLASCAVEETQKKNFTSTLDGLQKIARHEGPRSLWRGLSPTLLMAIPGNVIYFAGYDTLRYSERSPLRRLFGEQYIPLVAGATARVAAAIVVSPIEMLRTRMQAASGSTRGLFRETVLNLKDLVKAHGYTSLWRGLTLTMWRDVPFSGFYWWGYETVRSKLAESRAETRGRRLDSSSERRNRSQSRENYTSTFVDSAIAGATSGAIAAFVTTPFDVGKTRQQVTVHADDRLSGSISKLKGQQGGSLAKEVLPEERIMPRFLYHIFNTEGLPGLFRGWTARCLKVAPACAIMISSYEIGKKMAQDVNERRD